MMDMDHEMRDGVCYRCEPFDDDEEEQEEYNSDIKLERGKK